MTPPVYSAEKVQESSNKIPRFVQQIPGVTSTNEISESSVMKHNFIRNDNPLSLYFRVFLHDHCCIGHTLVRFSAREAYILTYCSE